jgi:hypothetical protein
MAGNITKRFRLLNAEKFMEMLTDPLENMYLCIGKSRPWTDDNNPPPPLDSIENVEYNVWDNIISAKKIVPNNVSFAAIRYNWVTGNVYNQYDISTEFQNGQFFVITDEYNVYKCMGNNNGAVSTVKPTGRLPSVVTTADGYRWKFMCEISAAEAIKYATTQFIPIKTLTSDDGSFQWDVQAAAVNGSISTVKVTAGGTGYKQHVGSIVSGNTTQLTIAPSANTTSGVYTGSSIYISSGAGAGQKRLITGYDGPSRKITVSPAFASSLNGTSAYIISPTVSVSGDGTGFSAYSTLSGTALKTIEVINQGAQYSRANVTISANTTSGGTGAQAIAQLSPMGGHGSNPIYELSAHNVIMYVQLSGDEEGKFFANNDFRVVSLISQPKLTTGFPADEATYLVAPVLNFSTSSGTFLADETVTGGTSGASGVVVEYKGTNSIIVTNVVGTFTNETITGGTSGATATVTSVTPSPFQKYSGSVMYLENRPPIVRSINQEENFRFVATF